MIGRTLAHYRIVEKIGAGGMGEVWRARDESLDRDVALKILPSAVSSDPERRQRFAREAKTLGGLQHPNIVTVHSIDEADGVHFLTMELVRGETLDAIVPEDGLPLDRLFDLSIPLADAVHAAHEHGVIHRDLKPGNIMVDGSGRLRVLDFGLAKWIDTGNPDNDATLARDGLSTQQGKILGTVSYMSPEQAEAHPLDRRSDVFSLGILLYEMSTGRRPFQGNSPISTLSAILRETPPSVTSVRPLPRHLGRIIQRCLEKNPDKRFQTARDVCNELEGLQREVEAGEVESISHLSGTSAPLSPTMSKRGTGAARWVGGAILGAAAATAIVYAVLSDPPDHEEVRTLISQPLTSAAGVEYAGSWSPDGGFFTYSHSANGPLDIFIQSTAGGDPVRLVESPYDDVSPAWSPDNRWIAFISSRASGVGIYLVPTLGGDARLIAHTGLSMLADDETLVIGSTPWSPQADLLAFSKKGAGAIGIWTVHLETGAEVQLTQPESGVADMAPTWSNDGTRIAFVRTEQTSRSLWTIPVGGGDPTRVPSANVAYVDGGAGWSPDDRQLVFGIRTKGGAQNLWAVNIASGVQRQLTFGTVDINSMAVSRDGRIMYDDFKHQTDLYLQSVETGASERLTFHSRSNFRARVSPDGNRIAYDSDRTGNDEIWILDRRTGKEFQLTNNVALDTESDWSPDGTELVFVSDRTGAARLWLAETTGGAARPLSDTDGTQHPRWSPDGSSVGYVGSSEEGSALWLVNRAGGSPRQILDNVISFEWYIDSQRVIYTPYRSSTEIRAFHTETGSDVLLLDRPHFEVTVDPTGHALSFCSGESHFNMNLIMLRLEEGADGLPHRIGSPKTLTAGDGLWHVHNGGWSADGGSVVYTRDTDTGDLYMLDGAF